MSRVPATVRARLVVGMGVVLLSLSAAMLVAVKTVGAVREDLRESSRQMIEIINPLFVSHDATLRQVAIGESRLVVGRAQDAGRIDTLGTLADSLRRILVRSPRLQAGERRALENVGRLQSLVEVRLSSARAYRDVGEADSAFLQGELAVQALDTLLVHAQEINASQQHKTVRMLDEAQRLAARSTQAMVLLLAVTLLAAAGCTWFTWRSVSHPLNALTLHARALGGGNLDARTPVETLPGEFQILGGALNQTGESLARLAEAEAALRESEKLSAVGLLVSGVAHELNNPLAAILLATEDLRDTVDGDRGAIDTIREQALRSRAIVRDLLSIVRKREALSDSFEVAALIERTATLLEPQLRGYGARLAVESPGVPLLARGEQRGMEQVLVNLVINAAQACGRGGVVELRSRVEDGVCHLTVEDNGPGIPPEMLTRIWEPFFTTKAPGEGSGLGLSVSRGIVERHGGNLRAENRTDGVTGARFTLTLRLDLPAAAPVQPDAVAETAARAPAPAPAPAAQEPPRQAVPAPPPPAAAPPAEAPGKPRVLVVDDEPSIRRLLRQMLVRHGWQVDEAADGAVALQMIEASPAFDAVISDMKMPGLSGMQLFARLLEQHPETAERVVFATGDNVAPDVAQFVQTMDQPVLDKPFTMDSLLTALADLRARNQAARQA